MHGLNSSVTGLNVIFWQSDAVIGNSKGIQAEKEIVLLNNNIGSHTATCRQPLPPQNGSVDDCRATTGRYYGHLLLLYQYEVLMISNDSFPDSEFQVKYDRIFH